MKKISIFCCLICIAAMSSIRSSAQISTDPAADSLERIWLIDSLQTGDSAVTAILAKRNDFLSKISALDADAATSAVTKKMLAVQYAGISNNRIRQMLGTERYNRYRDMIQRRIETYQLPATLKPLADAGH